MNDDLSALLAERKARAAVLLAAFDAAGSKARSRVTLVDYRCRRLRTARRLAGTGHASGAAAAVQVVHAAE